MNDLERIPKLPAVGKMFVALFTTLMLAVCLWAVWIYTFEKSEHKQIDQIEQSARQVEQEEAVVAQPDAVDEDHANPESRLRHNLGLAHVHVNGQTLLFFALGSVFLFTTVRARTKKIVLGLFAVAILVHAIGLSGAGFYAVFDDILALSGLAILSLIAYMCLMIYVDLGRKRKK